MISKSPLFKVRFFDTSRFPIATYLLLTSLAGCLLLAAGPAEASRPAVIVESLREVASDPTMAEVELVLSNNVPGGNVALGAIAKSRDGLMRTPDSIADDAVPAGNHLHVTLFIQRPPGVAAQRTEVLWVSVQKWSSVQSPNVPAVLGHARVKWVHVWPVIAQDPAGKAEEAADDLRPSEDLASVFYANLMEEDFDALDLLLQEWNTADQRNRNGEWKLTSFRTAIDQLVLSKKWDEVSALLGRWRHANRRSPGAALAEAEAWWRYAWTMRSCACESPNSGDPETSRRFRQRLQRAQRALGASRHYAAAYPLWYEEGLEILGAGKRDRQSTRTATRLFAEGVGKFPQYPPLYLAMADYWAPNDGRRADWGKVEAVADLAAEQSRETDGDDNYAWIYARISAHQQLDVDIVRDSLLSWPRMRAAFGELVKRYPSTDNYNLFAMFSCRAGDKGSYLNLRTKIQGHIERDLWPDNYPVDVCDYRFMQKT